SLTTKLCSSAAIAFIAGANPGASTCTPSSWAEIPLKLASPEPAVFWLATTLLPLRILTCAPATGRASGTTTETLISALQAQEAVETKTKKILGTKEKEREKEKLENTAHPPLHAKGLMSGSAPVSWLARAIAASLPAARGHSGRPKNCGSFSSRLAYSCAAARAFHPLPCLHRHDEDAQIREVVKNRPGRLEPRMYKRERTMSIAEGLLRLLADAIQCLLHLGVISVERCGIGFLGHADQLAHAHHGARKRLGNDELVPSIQYPSAVHRDVKTQNRRLR